MTPEQQEIVRIIIKEELSKFDFSDRFTIYKLMHFLDERNIQLGKSSGTKIGTETGQKIAFHGVTPSIQQAKISDPSGGGTIDTQARTAINSIIDVLENKGFTSAS